VRTTMTVLTLCAASAGYVYLQQTPATGETTQAKSNAPSLFDWRRDAEAKRNAPRVPVNELVDKIHEKTRSVLDDFANQHDVPTNAPVEDAFQRLKHAAESNSLASSDPKLSAKTDWSQSSRVPLPNLDDLQRTAFDPTAVEQDDAGLITATVREQPKPAEPAKPDNSVPAEQPTEASVAIEKTPAPAPAEKPVAVTEPATASPKMQIPTKDLVSSEAGNTNAAAISDNNPPRRTAPATAVATKRESTPVATQWKVIGKTTEGRPMHSMHLGTGGTRTLVIAGLYGDDRTAVRWLELLAEELAKHPDFLTRNEVVFLRAGNPDGLVRNVRDNARSVPLNRNFPSRRYRPLGNTSIMSAPASELETRVILNTLYTFRPRRVVHLMSTNGQSTLVYNRLAGRIGQEFERTAKVGPMSPDIEWLPGSIEDFSDGTLEAAVLSMQLSVGNDWQKAWTAMQSPVMSVVVGQSVDAEAEAKEFDPDRSPIPNANIEPVSRRPARRGYEELSAPPQ